MVMENKLEIGELAFERFGKHIKQKDVAVIGALVGLTVSAVKNSDWNWDRMTQKWQPKKFKKINEINEYYDRLEYIKYKGLYETAARKASLIEGTPIKQIFKELDKNKEKIAKLKAKQDTLLERHGENSRKYKAKNAEIQAEIEALTQRGNQMFTGGKWTKAAIAYKKAMESTIYGLQPGATKDEILAAVPDQYKDYFQAFMDETDEGERKKILKHLPDYLKRPLQAAWGEKMDDVGQSNRRYFRSHKLPGMAWRGWKPNVNLKHVKMKTIENEGMLLSDFGYYESEKEHGYHEENNKLEERIHTLEVYLEGAINYVILNGDVDNPIIKSVENILHMTFNRSSNTPNEKQKYTHAIKLLKRCYDDYVYLPPLRNEIEKFLEEV